MIRRSKSDVSKSERAKRRGSKPRSPKPRRAKAKRAVPVLHVSQYRGQWVALHPKTYEVLGHGSSLRAAEEQALAKGVKPIMYGVPKSDGYFVGLGNA